jgi:DNA-binding IscR family transcriptional regulator
MQCERAAECRTLGMWTRLDKMINEFFDGITLADLMFSYQAGNDYII